MSGDLRRKTPVTAIAAHSTARVNKRADLGFDLHVCELEVVNLDQNSSSIVAGLWVSKPHDVRELWRFHRLKFDHGPHGFVNPNFPA